MGNLGDYDGVEGSGLEYMRECDEPGCIAHALPSMVPYVLGRDDKGNKVWFRRWYCVAGHRYQMEDV